MKTIQDLDIKDKTILLRTDFNVPIKDGKIESDLRIRASLPTIQYLLEHKAKKIVIISHLGRPNPQDDPADLAKSSLTIVGKKLKSLLPPNTTFDFQNLPSLSSKPQSKPAELPNAQVVLLENLRFDPREEQNSPEFAKELIDFVKPDFFIQDGFAVTHRAHTSTVALAQALPAVAGLLLQKEISSLQKAITNPEHPLLLIIGGAKVQDKSPLIEQFSNQADQIAIGGKIAAEGYQPPKTSAKIYLAEDFDTNAAGQKLDIGPISAHKITQFVQSAKTVIWNGLLGYAEDPAYATSSTIIAEAIGEKSDLFSIICGGDTTGFVEQICKEHPNLHYSLISTGGGAALEFLLGHDLPGLKYLLK